MQSAQHWRSIPVCLWVWQLLQENSAEVRPASAGTGQDTEHEFASVNEMTSTNVLQYFTTFNFKLTDNSMNAYCQCQYLPA